MKQSVTGLLALSLLALAAAAPAAANLVTVSGSGLWAGNAPVTLYSVPGESFAFTFQIEQTYPVAYADAGLKLTTAFQAYEYDLNGAPVAGLPLNITFFDSGFGGGLALSYSDHSVEFFGPDIGSSGSISYFNNISFYPNIDDAPDAGGVVFNEGSATLSAVPEPKTWMLSLMGLGVVGGMVRSRRRALVSSAA
jgi:hypothetical protein